MALVVLRFVFVMVAVGLGFQLINSDVLAGEPAYLPWLVVRRLMLLVAGGDRRRRAGPPQAARHDLGRLLRA